MAVITFIYGKNKYKMEYTEKRISTKEIISHFIKLVGIYDLYFLYYGKKLIADIKKEINEKDIKIFVFNLKKKKEKTDCIICPECKNLSRIKFNNNKISTFKCINNHNINNLEINSFMNSQIIDEKAINCDICGNNKYLFYDSFYICSCGKKI